MKSNTTGEWTTQNGVNVWKFTATNGKSLFMPAAGYRDGSSLDNDGTGGYYWSSSLYESGPLYAWGMLFHSGGQYVDYIGSRYCGQSVRAVRSQN